ncbi:type-2 ice-structuring protein-like isoform X1 [Entelurus aequoreus]|uniref:type-2 ice-structuring protein-like isoform X1 n=2 Tax=Entelurus aequoreus TaxID=161455 RepID=UPI002B1DC9A5|nr:type-2 ice-structuring protein-like isoform X1 [Entelurus aequoreus]
MHCAHRKSPDNKTFLLSLLQKLHKSCTAGEEHHHWVQLCAKMRPSTTSLLCTMMALTAVHGHILSNSSCPGNWTDSGDRCFRLLPNPMIWSTAQKHCQAMGANLASVHNFSEVDLIHRMAGSQTPVWIGGSSCQEKNMWLWSDGTELDYTYWCPGHPEPDSNGCCLYISPKDGKCWEEFTCNNFHPSVCVMNHT